MLQHDSHTVTSRTMQGILRDDLFRLGGGPRMYGSYFIARNRAECMLMTILGFAPPLKFDNLCQGGAGGRESPRADRVGMIRNTHV